MQLEKVYSTSLIVYSGIKPIDEDNLHYNNDHNIENNTIFKEVLNRDSLKSCVHN